MNISLDLGLMIVQLLIFMFSCGYFVSEIKNMKAKLSEISTLLLSMEVRYFTVKEGAILENRVNAIGKKLDDHPCMRCINFSDHHEK